MVLVTEWGVGAQARGGVGVRGTHRVQEGELGTWSREEKQRENKIYTIECVSNLVNNTIFLILTLSGQRLPMIRTSLILFARMLFTINVTRVMYVKIQALNRLKLGIYYFSTWQSLVGVILACDREMSKLERHR